MPREVTFWNEGYHFNGSINSDLTLSEKTNGDIDVVNSYGEVMATIQDLNELLRFITDLNNGEYA